MKCHAYIRVSSRAQDHASQRSAIDKLAAQRGDTIEGWFAEKRSAKVLARPELDRLRAEVRAGRIKRLYLFRLDRLTRSGIADTLNTVEEMRSHGCEVVTVADGFDLNGPGAELVLCVLSWAAKMERLALGERVAAARDRLEAEGRAWGRPSRLTEEHRERICRLRAEGRTIRQIAIALKIPRSTVSRALSRKGRAQVYSSPPLGDAVQQGASQ